MSGSPHDGHDRRARRRVRAVGVTLISTGLVAVVEVFIGLVFRLESVFAEGLHTLADMFDSAVAFWAVRKSAKPPDRGHPFGHGKFESMAALIEGLVIAAAGGGICWSAANMLLVGHPRPRFATPAIAAMAVAAVLYLVISTWLAREAKQTKSPAVAAEAAHLRTHIYITGGLFVGLWLGRSFDWRAADAVMALVVGVVLLKTAWDVLRTAFGQLTDQALPEDDLRAIADELERFRDEFIEMHEIRSRASGAERHLDVHLVVAPEKTVRAAHGLCDRIEQAIAGRFPDTFVTIHVEPAEMATGQDAGAGQILIAWERRTAKDPEPGEK